MVHIATGVETRLCKSVFLSRCRIALIKNISIQGGEAENNYNPSLSLDVHIPHRRGQTNAGR